MTETPIFEKKNVLVIGGAGFIGSHLCERLLREAKVICVDDFSNSGPENISHLLQYPDFEFIRFDVTKPLDLTQFDELDKFKIKFQGIQEIYHLACPTSPKDFERLKMQSLAANSLSMLHTLNIAAQFHAKYVFASSSVVYGDATDEQYVFPEDFKGVVNHLTPRACYDEGKRFAETCVETYREVYQIDAKIARVFTTFGPRMRLFHGMLIPDFIVSALDNKDLVIYGDEKLSMGLCFVSDMVDGLVRLMASDPEVRVVNIGGDELVPMVDVAKKIITMTRSASEIVYEAPLLFLTRKGVPDLTYVKEALGWLPLVSLDDGLRRTIDYVSANKESLLMEQGR